MQGSRSHSTDTHGSNTYTPGRCILHLYTASHSCSPSYIYKLSVTISNQWSPSYCETCVPLGKQCPTTLPIPLSPNWSNSEEEKDLKVQNEAEEEIEDWGGDIQRQKELKLKNNNITIPQSSSESQFTSTSDMEETVVHTTQLSDTLVTSGNGEQKEDNLENKSEDSEDINLEDTIDKIV